MEDDSAPIEHSWSVSVGKIGPVQSSCTGPTFCPYRLISCLQLAHNTPHLSYSTFLYGTYSLGWSQERTADRLRTLRTLKLPGLPGTAVQVETWHSTTCVRFKGRVSWFFNLIFSSRSFSWFHFSVCRKHHDAGSAEESKAGELFAICYFSYKLLLTPWCLQHWEVSTPRCLQHWEVSTPRCLQHKGVHLRFSHLAISWEENYGHLKISWSIQK